MTQFSPSPSAGPSGGPSAGPSAGPRVSALHVEQMRAGERAVLAGAEAAVAALASDDVRVLERLPAKTMAARIVAELNTPVENNEPMSLAPLSLWLPIPAMVIGVFLVGGFDLIDRSPVDESVRIKGEAPALLLAKSDHGAVKDIGRGELVAQGDVVQVRVRGAGARFGVVVSVDGNGNVTRHLPASGTDTTLPTGTFALTDSFELDDAPRFERFFLVTSAAAVDVDAVVRAAQAVAAAKDPTTAALVVDDDATSWTDFLLLKGSKR
jgi:hypothetical protein